MSVLLLHSALEQYKKSSHCFEKEFAMVEHVQNFITNQPACFERIPGGHVTSSAWILNHDATHVLLTHHKKLNAWLQLGGHNDGDANCAQAALREAQEESGIAEFSFITPEIFDVDVHALPNACGFHYDIRYILRAPKDGRYVVSVESHNLAWVLLDNVSSYTPHDSIMRMVEKTGLVV